MEEEDHYTRITLRIPRDLHTRLAREAFITSKSQNAEIIARLQASFEVAPAAVLPPDVERAIQREVKEHGGTREDALARLVRAGQAQGGTVVTLSIAAGTTVGQIKEMIDAAAKILPADAQFFTEGH